MTPYCADRVVCDADSHLMETMGWLRSYADPHVRPRLAELNLKAFPDPAERPDYHPDYYEKGWGPEKIKDAEEHLLQRKHWSALGAVDRTERSRALDLLGFHRQFVFATFCWGQFDSLAYAPGHTERDPELLYGGARAHNRGVAEFCSDDERLLASAMVPLDWPDLATEMVDEVLKAGCRGVIISSSIMSDRTWSHPAHDPVWVRLSEAGVPAVLHIGAGVFELPKAIYNNGKRPTYMMASEGMEGWQIQDLYSNWWTVPLFLQALAVDGVFEKFPGLKVSVCEYETGWLPHFLHRVDTVQATAQRKNPEEYSLPRRASDYIRERVKFAPVPGTPEPWHHIITSIEGGERMFMFNSDYPHGEGSPDPVGVFEKEMVKFAASAERVRELFYSENFFDVYGS